MLLSMGNDLDCSRLLMNSWRADMRFGRFSNRRAIRTLCMLEEM